MSVVAVLLVALIALAVGLALGAAVGRLHGEARGRAAAREEYAREAARQEAELGRMRDAVKAAAADALAQSTRQLVALTGDKLETGRRELGAAVDPVAKSLERMNQKIDEMERTRAEKFGALDKWLASLQDQTRRLHDQADGLSQALRATGPRGRWGEIQLRQVVELAGMVEHCDFDVQRSLPDDERVGRPDLVVKLPGGLHVAVDAKAPLDDFLRAAEASDDGERKKFMIAHASKVRLHARKLADRQYWRALEAEVGASPALVVMFLPSDTLYGAALAEMHGLFDEAAQKRVLIATPTTLIALLQTIHFGWNQERLADNAEQVSREGRELHRRLAIMLEHWNKIGASLGRAVEAFNGATGSLQRNVVPSARRLAALGAAGDKDVPELQPIDKLARELAAVD